MKQERDQKVNITGEDAIFIINHPWIAERMEWIKKKNNFFWNLDYFKLSLEIANIISKS